MAIVKLSYIGDDLHAEVEGSDAPVRAKLLYLQPLSERHDIAVIDMDGNELAALSGLDGLDDTSRRAAIRAIETRYLLPLITRIRSVETQFGTHYWVVETARGQRAFALKEPGKNITWLGPDRLILRDTMGNRYEIGSLSKLDTHSQRAAGSIL